MTARRRLKARRDEGSRGPDSSGPGGAAFPALLALVFFSGFAALVYELLWFRRLGLIFGNTVQAAATVLAAFMAGLAFGAQWARRWISRTANLLRLFGIIEAGIGLYALLVPAAFALAQISYQLAAQRIPDAPALLTGLRFCLALVALFIPTVLMGASLPVLAGAALTGPGERFAARLGVLYGSNTAGATLGVLACGFFLVARIGVTWTNLLAAGANLAVGGMAVWMARRAQPIGGQSEGAVPPWLFSRKTIGILAVAAFSGGLALAFETVWFRALVLVLGSTSYSFAIMVACFLLGISLGSSLLGRFAGTRGQTIWALAAAMVGTGLWTLISLRWFNEAPKYFLRLLARLDFSWNGMLLTKLALSAVFLLPLAALSGFAFTAIVRLVRESTDSAGDAVGSALSVNALGSAIGAGLAGFVILPALGLERSLWVFGLGAMLVGVVIRLAADGTSWPRRVMFGAATAALGVVGWISATPWDPLVLSSGPYFTARANVAGGEVQLFKRLSTVELALYREGVTATVDVKRTSDGRLYYSSNGKVEADSSPQSMTLQRMMGHLPMLFHANPRDVLNIGLGAGVTAGALTCYPRAIVEVADIEPASADIATFWAPRNHGLMKAGKFTLRINDGRNHLLVTTNRYDVITSDPFEPVVAGAASLYTVDHFRLARSRLRTNGVMAQFLPLYELSREDVMMILRSFVRVFPRTSVFFTGCDTILLGLTGEQDIDLRTAIAKMSEPAVAASLAEVGVNRPERLLDMLAVNIVPGSRLVEDGPVNTDDRPIIEFSAPRSALEYRADANQQVLLELFGEVPAAYLANLTPEAAQQVKQGHAALRLLLEASILRSRGDLPGGVKALSAAFAQAPASPIVRNELAQSLVMLAQEAKSPAEAFAMCQEGLRVDPGNFWAIYNAVVHADEANQSGAGDEYLRKGLEAYPDSALLLALRGKRAGKAGDIEAACRDYESVVRKFPRCADFWQDYAHFLGRAGRQADADAAAGRAGRLRDQ